MRDAELMINSGVCINQQTSKLFYTGGLCSLLPLLDLIRVLSIYGENQPVLIQSLDVTFNEFLKLTNAIISSKAYSNFEQEQPVPFFTVLFHLLQKLPSSAVNSNTI